MRNDPANTKLSLELEQLVLQFGHLLGLNILTDIILDLLGTFTKGLLHPLRNVSISLMDANII